MKDSMLVLEKEAGQQPETTTPTQEADEDDDVGEGDTLKVLLGQWSGDYWRHHHSGRCHHHLHSSGVLASGDGSQKKQLLHLKSKHILEVVDDRHRHAGILIGYAEEFLRCGSGTSLSTARDFFVWLADRNELDLPQYPRRFLGEWEVEFLQDAELSELEVVITPDGLLKWKASGELVSIPTGEVPLQRSTSERLQRRAEANAHNEFVLPELRRRIVEAAEEEGEGDEDVSTATMDSIFLSLDGADNPSNGEIRASVTPALRSVLSHHKHQGDKQLMSRAALLQAIDHDLGVFSHVSKNSDAKGIYVWQEDGTLVVATKVRGVLQHTSLSHGCPVLMAGGICIEDGRLLKVTSHSGHYRPKEPHLRAFKTWLEEQGAKLDCCTFEDIKQKTP